MDNELTQPLGELSPLYSLGTEFTKQRGGTGHVVTDEDTNALRLATKIMQNQDQELAPNRITAYHGSPHEFDQFDSSKIGTGEGNQSYGHGLYFAESEPVAKGYRDKLSSVSPEALEQYFKPGEIIAGYGGKDKVLDYDPQSRVVKVQGIDSRGKLEPHVRTHQTMPDLNEVNAAFKERGLDPHIPGYMYEVAIDAHPDHFLDWDKPFDNQSQHVQRALTTGRNAFSKQDLEDIQKMYGKYNGNFGAAFHEFLQSEYPSIKNQKMASNWLSKRGIHGIKYLDAGSRGATDQPNHNYVVFDHNRVKVKRRYKKGGRIDAYGGYIERTKRSTGGRIPEADKLFKAAKKDLDGHTKSMLNVHDDAIVNALRIAQGRI